MCHFTFPSALYEFQVVLYPHQQYHQFFKKAFLIPAWWNLTVVLILISLLTTGCLFTLNIFFVCVLICHLYIFFDVLSILFKSSHLKNGSLVFLILSFESSFYILNASSLSDMYFVNTFSLSVTCLSIFLSSKHQILGNFSLVTLNHRTFLLSIHHLSLSEIILFIIGHCSLQCKCHGDKDLIRLSHHCIFRT